MIVYKHTCPNGKVYIGQTSQKPERRWSHGNGYKENSYFYRAIQKYGWDNIKHEIIAENLTQEEADSLEIELIERYKATDRNSGYNHHYGGQIHDVCSVEDLLKEDCLPYEIIEESELLTKVFDNLIELALGIEWTETIERKYFGNNQLQKVEKEVIKRKNKPSYFAIRTLLDNYSDCKKVKPLKDKLEKMRYEIEENF